LLKLRQEQYRFVLTMQIINFKNQNNLLIIAVSVGLGTGISAVPQAFKALGAKNNTVLC
jgi:xanthine/uracil permease